MYKITFNHFNFQLILRANSGIDFIGFHHFLSFITTQRIESLEQAGLCSPNSCRTHCAQSTIQNEQLHSWSSRCNKTYDTTNLQFLLDAIESFNDVHHLVFDLVKVKEVVEDMLTQNTVKGLSFPKPPEHLLEKINGVLSVIFRDDFNRTF